MADSEQQSANADTVLPDGESVSTVEPNQVDQEQRQSIARILISSIALIISLVAGQLYNTDTIVLTAVFIAHLTAGLLVFATIRTSPGDFFLRKLSTILLDMSATSFTVYYLGLQSIVVYPLYLWIIVGNGMRFGVRYLYLALGVAIVMFTTASYFSELWAGHMMIAFALNTGFVILALFYTSLIKQLHQLNSQLAIELDKTRHASLHDTLTDLPNRSYFSQKIKEALSAAAADQQFFAVAYLDLNKFKPVNDNYGHAYGDLLLQGVSQRMRAGLRDGDFVARLGGDEFGIIFTTEKDLDGVSRTLDRISAKISEPYIINGAHIEVSASIGIGCYPLDGMTEDELVKQADQNMYISKASDMGIYQSSTG